MKTISRIIIVLALMTLSATIYAGEIQDKCSQEEISKIRVARDKIFNATIKYDDYRATELRDVLLGRLSNDCRDALQYITERDIREQANNRCSKSVYSYSVTDCPENKPKFLSPPTSSGTDSTGPRGNMQ